MNSQVKKYLRNIYLEDEIKDILIVNDFISVNVKIEEADIRCFPVLNFLYVHFVNDEIYISSNKPVLVDNLDPLLRSRKSKKSKNKVKFAERPNSEKIDKDVCLLERSMTSLDLTKSDGEKIKDKIEFTLYRIKINYI